MSATERKRDDSGMVHRPGCEEPDVVKLCECGGKMVCRTCHWGRGAWPCACQREHAKFHALQPRAAVSGPT